MQALAFLLVNSIAVYATAYILPGITIDNITTVVIVAIVLGVLNTFVKPLLLLLTLPITIITLGLFSFVINAALVMLASMMIPGFHVDNFLWALAFAVVLSLISSFLNSLVRK